MSRIAPPVRRHYDLADGAGLVMRGVMNVRYSRLGWPLVLAGRLFGALVPVRGAAVPVCVRNWTRPGCGDLQWHRAFAFPGRDALVFASQMRHAGGNEIVEYVGFGLGIRLRLSEREGALVYESHGYEWQIGPVKLPIPDWLLLGRAEIVERPVDGNRFRLDFAIRHPLWGETFGYDGDFAIEE